MCATTEMIIKDLWKYCTLVWPCCR